MPSKLSAISRASGAQLAALGAQLRARRKQLGISAIAAAESAGMSRVTWYRIEKGAPSVTAGAYANAAATLDVAWTCAEPGAPDATRPARAEGWLPLEIRIADYPELRQLAWQMPGTTVLTPRQALNLYERNARHVDEAALGDDERALIDALRKVFSDSAPDV